MVAARDFVHRRTGMDWVRMVALGLAGRGSWVWAFRGMVRVRTGFQHTRIHVAPRPQDKILQSMSRGQEVTITNDGATILKSIYVDNPAAKVLVGETGLT